MSQSRKYIAATAVALAMIVSGAALAGSTAHELGGYTSPFDTSISYQQSLNTGEQVQTVWNANQRIQTESQQASVVTHPQADWVPSIPASRDDLYNPE
jgi:hypothetical protein